MQILVHGLPTDRSLPDIAQELTTFNTGLALSRPPRWLTPDDRRAANRISHLTTVVPPSASPQLSLLSPDQGHKMSLHAIASPPSPQHSRLNTIFASTTTHNVIAATSLAITLYAAPTHPAVAGVLGPTLRGTTSVPPLPALRRAALVHTPHLSVSHVPALTRHILPSIPSAPPLSPVRRVGRMTRCTSIGGFSSTPFTYFWQLSFLLCCPQGRPCSFSGLLCPARRGWPHF